MANSESFTSAEMNDNEAEGHSFMLIRVHKVNMINQEMNIIKKVKYFMPLLIFRFKQRIKFVSSVTFFTHKKNCTLVVLRFKILSDRKIVLIIIKYN